MRPLEIGIVSDEISPSFVEAVGFAKKWGVSLFELRCLQTGRAPNVHPTELRQIRESIEHETLRITALSPGIFKHPVSHDQEIEREINETLPATIALAKDLKTSLIIVFGFIRERGEPSGHFDAVVGYLARAASLAKQNGIRIAVENELGFWCDTGSATAELIRCVGSDALGANWDPANAVGSGERPFPEGYNALKDSILNIHVKDTEENSLVKCVPVGDGVVDWRGQLRALSEDAKTRHVTIETHCLPLVERSQQNVATVRTYLQELEHGD